MAIYNGNSGDNELRDPAGDSVDDEFYGFDGNDRLISNGGNDKLYGGNGGDILFGALGDNYMEGGAGRDALFADSGNDTGYGGDDDDTLAGGDGDDVLYGGNGIDLVSGDNGNDVVYGGNGDDYSGLGGGLYGGEGNDALDGGDGLDTINGDNGDDLISGGLGIDHMDGGNGNDTVDYRFATLGGTIDLVIQRALIDGVQESFYLFENAYGSQGSDVITGSAEANKLWGEGGNDTLDGGLGADTMAGGAGDDTYSVDDVGDVVTEGLGKGMDLVKSSVTLTLGANLENLTLLGAASINGIGNSLNNTITGNSAANTLSGGNGDDLILGGLGTDSLDGGAGNDTVDYRFSAVGGTINLASQVAVIGGVSEAIAAFENAYGSQGDDVMTGSAAANRLWGEGGRDVLNGGAGADLMAGGADDDTYSVDDAGDVVTEGLGKGVDLVKSSVTLSLGANVENLTLLGAASINGIGNTLNNTITGNSAANTLSGGGGDDLISGGLGIDIMNGGAGNDTVDYQFSAVGGSINLIDQQALIGGVQETFVSFENAYGSQGGDDMTGSAAANLLWGGGGNDSLDGRGGADTLYGEQGNDTYTIRHAGATVIEDAGDGVDLVKSSVTFTLGANIENLTLLDYISLGPAHPNGTGNALDNVIVGNWHRNTLFGDSGNDRLHGNAANDQLLGGAGNDALFGGTGRDSLNGGSGSDQFVFDTKLNQNSNLDTIMDFNTTDDTIQLENAIFTQFKVRGPIAASRLVSGAGAVAADANDNLLYDTDTGVLSYDADGSGTGAAVPFVILTGLPVLTDIPVLTAADFYIV